MSTLDGAFDAVFGDKFRAAADPNKNGGRTAARAPEVVDMQNIERLEPAQRLAPVKTTTELVTPERARWLRDRAHFSRQRAISPANVSRLSREMTEGRFTPGTQIYICVLPDRSERIVNGNHTLEAVVESGTPQMLSVTRLMVKDEDEAGRIYAVFDIQKARTWRDSLRATGAGDDLPFAPLALSALGVIENSFGHKRLRSPSRLDRIDQLEDYREPLTLWADAVSGASRHNFTLMKRAAVMAVALTTLRYQPSAGVEFWSRVAQDNGLISGMPEKALLNWMRNTTAQGGQPAQKEHANAAALAWNAAFRGEERTYVKPNSMGAFFLLGTPHSRGLGE